MNAATEIITELPSMPMDRVLAMIVLAAFGLAAFALYVVLTAIKDRSGK